MSRRIDVLAVFAVHRLKQVNRLHFIEIQDILKIDDGDDERWNFYKPQLRDFASGFESPNGRRLIVEPILALFPTYPWWTAYATSDLLLSNHKIRTRAWISETRRRFEGDPELAQLERDLRITAQSQINMMSASQNSMLFAQYLDETRTAHEDGETFIALTGSE